MNSKRVDADEPSVFGIVGVVHPGGLSQNVSLEKVPWSVAIPAYVVVSRRHRHVHRGEPVQTVTEFSEVVVDSKRILHRSVEYRSIRPAAVESVRQAVIECYSWSGPSECFGQ